MKILITGANGFIGNALLGHYHKMYKKDVVVGLRGKKECNLLDFAEIKQNIDNICPDVVIHVAGNIGGLIANKDNPGRFIYDNLQIGLNVIEASRLAGVKKFVNISTVCSYPANPPTIPFIEKEIYDGKPIDITGPYGHAKRAIHEVLVGYNKQYGFNGITTILTNVYGVGDHIGGSHTHVISALIEKFLKAKEGDTIQLLGDGTATREFIYIDDCVRAISLCTEHYESLEPINIGTGIETPIAELAEIINELVGKKLVIEWDKNQNLNGQQRRCLNTSKLQKLGFTSKIDLKNGLNKTIEYFKSKLGIV